MAVVRRMEDVSKKKAFCFLIISNLVFAIIPVFFIIIGLLNITTCPGNSFLPIWLIGVAIFIILDRLMFWKILMNEIDFEKSYPRPETDDYELIKTWEKNRANSSSKILLLVKTNFRILFFLGMIFGAFWSQELAFKDTCAPIVVFSVLFFSIAALICYLVSFIGTFYIHCVAFLSEMDLKAKISLHRVM